VTSPPAFFPCPTPACQADMQLAAPVPHLFPFTLDFLQLRTFSGSWSSALFFPPKGHTCLLLVTLWAVPFPPGIFPELALLWASRAGLAPPDFPFPLRGHALILCSQSFAGCSTVRKEPGTPLLRVPFPRAGGPLSNGL